MLDESYAQLRQEEERGSNREACACGAEDWPKRAAGARAATATGGRRRRGTTPVGAADVEARWEARGGGSRWSGGDDWPEPACGSTVHALQSARVTGIDALSLVWSAPACPTVSSKQRED